MLRFKPRLYLLYENGSQIRTNCYIAQLYTVLNKQFKLVMTSSAELVRGNYRRPQHGEKALSLLKQRNWPRLSSFLARYAQHSGIFLYDQDPWEAYHDRASSPGVYSALSEIVNVKQFLVTSGWWAVYIKNRDKLPVSFVKMGVLPRHCHVGPTFAKRPYELGFQGTLHAHRQKFFNFLKNQGEEVVCLPGMSFKKFLKSIQQIGIFVHDEHADVCLDGVPSLNGIWIKDIEVAARGCFSIRNADLDLSSYEVESIPTIFTYKSIEEVPALIKHIRAIPEMEKNRRIKEAVACIRRRQDWNTVVKAIEEN